MDNMNNTDILTTVLHLRQASTLLKVKEPTISDMLLIAATKLLEKYGLQLTDVENANELVKKIESQT